LLRKGVGLIVINHEFADDAVLGEQGDEGETPDAFALDHIEQRLERSVRPGVGGVDRSRVARLRPPGRMSRGSTTVFVREAAPRLEAHDAVWVKEEEGSP